MGTDGCTQPWNLYVTGLPAMPTRTLIMSSESASGRKIASIAGTPEGADPIWEGDARFDVSYNQNDGWFLEIINDDTPFTGTIVGTIKCVGALDGVITMTFVDLEGVPEAPSIQVTSGDESITIAWIDPPQNTSAITSHTIYIDGSMHSTTGAASPVMITGFTNETEYSVQVISNNATGSSGLSVARLVTPG